MRFTLTVEVEVHRSRGKFPSRDDVLTEIQQAIEDANPGSLDVNEAEVEVDDWQVSEVPQPKRRRRR